MRYSSDNNGLPIKKAQMITPTLRFKEKYKIEDSKRNLNEPSGLAYSKKSNSLWTICDESRNLFKMSLDGKVFETISIAENELEGVCLSPDESAIYAVKEIGNELLKIDPDSGRILKQKKLSDLNYYHKVKKYLKNPQDENEGLEGITYHPGRDSLFLVKEISPRLLIEVTPNLETVLRCWKLGKKDKLFHAETRQSELDLSGICYDEQTRLLWILSHKAQTVFLYNLKKEKFVDAFSLSYTNKAGEKKKIHQAEGLALIPDTNYVYIKLPQNLCTTCLRVNDWVGFA